MSNEGDPLVDRLRHLSQNHYYNRRHPTFKAISGDQTSRREFLKTGLVGGFACGFGWASLKHTRPSTGARGTLFVHSRNFSGQEGLDGIFAVNLADATWRHVCVARYSIARVSPSGRLLAIPSWGRDSEPNRGIWLHDTFGGREPEHLADLTGRPSWLDDRMLIVSGAGSDSESDGFSKPGQNETWRVPVEGKGAERLSLPGTHTVVDATRDGKRLLVEINDENSDRSSIFSPLFVVRPDGSGQRRLLDPGISGTFARISPDGRSVVFYRYEGTDAHHTLSLEAVPLDGGKTRRLVEEANDMAPFNGTWSPDGRRLALQLFDRSIKEDGKKNDVVRDCRIAVYDIETKKLDVLPIGPSRLPLWVLDWRA